MKQKTSNLGSIGSKTEQDIFSCELCNYITHKKFNLNRHYGTVRHMKRKRNKMEQNGFFFCICGGEFKSRTTFWRHKKVCQQYIQFGNADKDGDNVDDMGQENVKIVSNVVLTDVNELQPDEYSDNINELTSLVKKLIEQNKDLTNKIVEMAKESKTINNKFNLQIFLNETCKDAINISDFVQSLTVGCKELNWTKEKGLIEGISTVFVNGLRDMEINKRPIHCTDIKREILYIKDEDTWEKNNNEKIKQSIDSITQKHIKAIHEWEKIHPDWKGNEALETEYMRLVQKVMESVDDSGENKIIRNISKEVQIKKN